MNHIHIIEGDLTKARADAIVNAANPMMLGGGGVDGAIHKAAGPKLLQACQKVKAENGIRCPFGEARITRAGNLQCGYVIHTAGPIFKTDKDPRATLASCYRNSLQLALTNDLKSIAFPAISCGAYGYPIAQAATVAMNVCIDPKYNSIEIFFYIYGVSDHEVWRTVFNDDA